jgi:hypothetical protein
LQLGDVRCYAPRFIKANGLPWKAVAHNKPGYAGYNA